MTHLLVIDHDSGFRLRLVHSLKSRGHRITAIDSVDALAATLAIHRPDVVLLDLQPDNSTSFYVCEQLRGWSSIPLIMMSDSSDEPTKVRSLDAGADDYLVKPFGVDELMARVRAIERRLNPRLGSSSPQLTIGDLTIDLAARIILLNEQPVHLTRKEYELLKVLAMAQGQLVSYEKLLSAVWGEERNGHERANVRTLVKQLRRKLQEDLDNPIYLLTEAGIGYRLNVALSGALVDEPPDGVHIESQLNFHKPDLNGRVMP